MRREIGIAAFQTWFVEVYGSVEDGRLVVSCPDTFVRDWIAMRYGELLQRTSGCSGGIIYRARKAATAPAPDESPRTARSSREVEESPGAGALALTVGAVDADQKTLSNFVGGQENALALEAARSLLAGDLGRCNPLVISGPTGVGKSHLCEAIQNGHSESVVYRSSEEFTAEVTQAIRSNQMPEIRHRYRRAANVLILDDIQFLENKTATQMELFHTLEHLLGRGCPVVLTSDRPPHELAGLDEKLRSRLSSGLVARIVPPELASRRRILRDSAAAGGVHVPEACLEMLATRPVKSSRDLLSGLTQVVARATLLRRPIDEGLVHEALGALAVPTRAWGAREIAEGVAHSFGFRLEELQTRSRKGRFALPRQVAMFLCRRFTDASLQEIGDLFGRDHSTVSYAVEVIERRVLTRAQLRYQLEEITRRLGLSS